MADDRYVVNGWRLISERHAAEAANPRYEEPHAPPPPPRIPARGPRRAEEYATSNRGLSATKLGRLAAERGWDVEPWYWMAADGTEGCAVRFRKGDFRAVATWKRPPGAAGTLTGWGTDVAYAWVEGVARAPSQVTHTVLEGILT